MPPATTWEIQRSIPLELDIFFTLFNDYLPHASLSDAFASFLDRIPADMLAEIQALLGEGKHFYSLFVPAAYAAGTLFEEDYTRATLPIRQMSAAEAVELTLLRAAQDGIQLEAAHDLPAREQLKQVQVDLLTQSGKRLGFLPEQGELRINYLKADIDLLVRFLKDGDLHARFWHWMDRFYYQIFEPWRIQRQELMATQENKARLALGAPGSTLQLDWLPQSNPLRIGRELLDSLKTQGMHIIFVVEAFQLPDFWLLLPCGPMTSFAEGTDVYHHIFAFIEDLSVRLKALADPTRLVILRSIRSSPQDNTSIAIHMGVSRPTVSIHAKQLREAGLIRTYEKGRSVRHEIIASEVRRLFHDLERFLDLPPEEDKNGGHTD
jgi:DNA-binding transcriptional ArsR family regulator